MSNLCFAFAAAAIIAAPSAAQDWTLLRPSNTGLPGEEVRVVRWAPDGRIWVLARWPFWEEGGIGIYDPATGLWETYSNASTGKGQGPLPSEYLNDLEFEPDGTAWIATDGGLVRFDGQTWTTYTTANSPLLHNAIDSISLAPNGDVWINNSTVQGGPAAIFRFNGQDWAKFTVGHELPWDEPWVWLGDVYAAADGHVWVSNDVLNGVAEYDGTSWILRGEETTRFGKITGDRSGNIWLLAGVGGGDVFYRYDGTSFKQYSAANTPLSATTLTNMASGTDGSVFVSNWFGEVIRTQDFGDSWKLFTSIETQVYNIAPDPSSDEVWLGSPGALRHYDAGGEWLEAFNSYNTGVGWWFIDDVHLGGRSGLMYIASMENGVSWYDGERWDNLGSHNPNRPWPAMADGAEGVFEDSAGNLWIGTNGIARWDGTTFDLWDWSNTPGLGVGSWSHIGEDMNGVIWAGETYGALFKFQGGTFIPADISPYYMYGIESDSQGNLYVLDWFTLYRWDGSSWTTWDGPPQEDFFDLGGTTCLKISPEDVVWVGTNDGLVRFDGGSWTIYDTGNSPLPAAQVQGVDFRADGALAVSAHEFGPNTPFPNGVSYIVGDIDDPANWQTWEYGTSPLPHYQLGDVDFDIDGDLWISAFSGEAIVVVEVGRGRCFADFDGSGGLDLFDFLAFVNAFTAGDDAADCDGDAALNLFDFLCFTNAFNGGC